MGSEFATTQQTDGVLSTDRGGITSARAEIKTEFDSVSRNIKNIDTEASNRKSQVNLEITHNFNKRSLSALVQEHLEMRRKPVTSNKKVRNIRPKLVLSGI